MTSAKKLDDSQVVKSVTKTMSYTYSEHQMMAEPGSTQLVGLAYGEYTGTLPVTFETHEYTEVQPLKNGKEKRVRKTTEKTMYDSRLLTAIREKAQNNLKTNIAKWKRLGLEPYGKAIQGDAGFGRTKRNK